LISSLYRSNRNIAQIIQYNNAGSLSSSNYAHNKATKVVSHGWNSDATSDACVLVKNRKFNIVKVILSKRIPISEFLDNLDVNVICVDWGEGASALYPTAVNYVPQVGRFVGNFVDWLIAQGSSVGNFHIMGHSLGGHIVGIAGRTVTRGRIPYITGELVSTVAELN
jgi:pancreatic triacylglycerol lipase